MTKNEIFNQIVEQFNILQCENNGTTKASQARARKAAGAIMIVTGKQIKEIGNWLQDENIAYFILSVTGKLCLIGSLRYSSQSFQVCL